MLTRRDLGKVAATGAMTLAMPLRHALAASRPTLTIAVDNLWSTMAPINGISTTTLRIFPNFYEKLIERDYVTDPLGLVLAPKLATKWEQNGDVWTITLREGVKFHNGQEMTAEDVEFTLSAERLWGPKPIEPRGKTFTDGFKRVQATGKYTVEIETVQARSEHSGQAHRLYRHGRAEEILSRCRRRQIRADADWRRPL